MWKITQPLIRCGKDERGATAVEYGLILALIVLALLTALQLLAGITISMWGDVSANVQANS